MATEKKPTKPTNAAKPGPAPAPEAPPEVAPTIPRETTKVAKMIRLDEGDVLGDVLSLAVSEVMGGVGDDDNLLQILIQPVNGVDAYRIEATWTAPE